MAIARKGNSILYGLDGQLIGNVGSAGQVRQGHILTTKSFPAALTVDNSKLSFWNMNGQINGSIPADSSSFAYDEMGARNLTNVATVPFTGSPNVFGVAGAATFNGSTQGLTSNTAVGINDNPSAICMGYK